MNKFMNLLTKNVQSDGYWILKAILKSNVLIEINI
jgi:hypothetical protein